MLTLVVVKPLQPVLVRPGAGAALPPFAPIREGAALRLDIKGWQPVGLAGCSEEGLVGRLWACRWAGGLPEGGFPGRQLPAAAKG